MDRLTIPGLRLEMASPKLTIELYKRLQQIENLLDKYHIETNADLKDALATHSMFKRMVQNDENYVNSEFGTDNNRLYIDGTINYGTKDARKVIKKWIRERKTLWEDIESYSVK